MTRTTNLVLFTLLIISMTSCSWAINLVIANNSNKDIFVRYLIPLDNEDAQFFKNPKTYQFDEKLRKLYRANEGKRPNALPTDSKTIIETQELEVRLAPGQAVHVGVYYSFQDRREILSKYNLNVRIDQDSTLTLPTLNSLFLHWKNRHTDLLEVR